VNLIIRNRTVQFCCTGLAIALLSGCNNSQPAESIANNNSNNSRANRDSVNAIVHQDLVNAIGNYDTAFLGEPMADTAMQHNKDAYIIYGCAYCHGLYLTPAVGEAGNLMKSVYVANDVDANMISAILRTGVPATAKTSPMPQFSDLSEREYRNLAAYIHYTRAAENYKLLTKETDKPGNAAVGKTYFQATCVSCHSGNKDLAGISKKYQGNALREQVLNPNQFRESKSAKMDSHKNTDLSTAQAKHQLILGNYKADEVSNLVAYLETLK
jgi:mono/diheme cytochrome c family protein